MTCPETLLDDSITIWFAMSVGVATFLSGVLEEGSVRRLKLRRKFVPTKRVLHIRCGDFLAIQPPWPGIRE